MIVEVLEEHDFSEGSLQVQEGKQRQERVKDRPLGTRPRCNLCKPLPTCASVAFWKASKIFLSATTSPVLRSFAFQTTPYACESQTLTKPSNSAEPLKPQHASQCYERECLPAAKLEGRVCCALLATAATYSFPELSHDFISSKDVPVYLLLLTSHCCKEPAECVPNVL